MYLCSKHPYVVIKNNIFPKLEAYSHCLSTSAKDSNRSMSKLILKTEIPCENCANSITKTLTILPGVKNVICSVQKGEILVEIDDGRSVADMRTTLIEKMKKTGRKCI